MSGSKSSPWVFGTVFLSLVVVVLTWFFGISPRLESAADTNEQTEFEQSRLDLLEVELAGLERDFANIDDFRDQLSQLRTQIPARTELSDLTRDLTAVADSAGMSIVNLSPSVPTAILPPAVDAAPVDPASGAGDEAGDPATSSDDAVATDGATGTVPAPAPAFEGFYAVPISITAVGTYDATLAFISQLQTSMPRLFLVSTLNATAQTETGAGGGRPAVADGDIELEINAFAFVLADLSAPVAPEDEPVPALPKPAGQKNPFAPSA